MHLHAARLPGEGPAREKEGSSSYSSAARAADRIPNSVPGGGFTPGSGLSAHLIAVSFDKARDTLGNGMLRFDPALRREMMFRPDGRNLRAGLLVQLVLVLRDALLLCLGPL